MPGPGTKIIASNRKARHDFSILDVFEAGIMLQGSEVKSLREGQVQLADAYARINDGEVWLGVCTSRRTSSPTAWEPTTRIDRASCCCIATRSPV